MGIGEEAGKAVSSVTESLRGTPVLLGFIVMVAVFLAFVLYDSHQTNEREKAQFELIAKLVSDVRDCRQGPKQ
jgi:hypothetical protein